jgi:hypothetical protein
MHDQVQERPALRVLLFLRLYLNVFVGCRAETQKRRDSNHRTCPESNGGLVNRSIQEHKRSGAGVPSTAGLVVPYIYPEQTIIFGKSREKKKRT